MGSEWHCRMQVLMPMSSAINTERKPRWVFSTPFTVRYLCPYSFVDCPNIERTITGAGALVAPLVSTQFSQLPRWSFHYLASLGIALSNTVMLIAVFRFKTQEGRRQTPGIDFCIDTYCILQRHWPRSDRNLKPILPTIKVASTSKFSG